MEISTHSLALVEDEAIALEIRAARLFKIFENAPFELIHMLDTDFLHMNRGFFAAGATRARLSLVYQQVNGSAKTAPAGQPLGSRGVEAIKAIVPCKAEHRTTCVIVT